MQNDMFSLFLCVGADLDGLCRYFVLDFWVGSRACKQRDEKCYEWQGHGKGMRQDQAVRSFHVLNV